ncbi:NACHT domain-containing protein [Leisingera sp. S232]|uniref:NACHT domain-containing protein n=1 Tax=Leisingera sp. S232 TaxID=3415132 RepID=UPI003C79D899
MSSELDPNAIAAATLSDLAKEFFVGSTRYLKTTTKKKWEKIFPNFEKHLTEVHKRSTSVKVLCSPDAPTDFQSVYVCPKLKGVDGEIEEFDLVSRIRDGENAIIRSNGGTGKTFLMRHIWLSLFTEPKGKFPVFIELRGLNDPSKLDLETYIRAMAFKAGGISVENFREFCNEGQFIFLFDGFDEVKREQRAPLEAQILEMADRYLKCSFIVTGRPDDRFSSWSRFPIFSCLPFSYDQFCELIEKVPFDSVAKKKFQKLSNETFFNNHKDFLSNPLLSLMMLMTYKDHAEIPSKLSVFYENCFLTLFTRHDALKEQYHRKKKLDQDEFRRVFSVFCFFSYLKQKPQMGEDELRTLTSKAIEFTGIGISVDDLVNEFIETVNLIEKDGTIFRFIHRSFQEYFAAYCATKVLTEKSKEALSVFASRHLDTTLRLCHEMHPDLVASEYLLPEYKRCSESGLLPTNFQKSKPFEALAACQFKLSFSFTKGHEISRTTSWGPCNQYQDIVSSFDRIFLNENYFESGIGDMTYELHTICGEESRAIHDSKMKRSVTIDVEVSFTETGVDYDISTSKDYSRIPKAISIFAETMKGHTLTLSGNLEKLHRRKNVAVAKIVEGLSEQAEDRSTSLIEEFGL